MLLGGFTGSGSPTSCTGIIDLGLQMPSWSGAAHMAFRRKEQYTVLLPDGKLLVVGGQSNANGGQPEAVLESELYSPDADSWEQVASLGLTRMYHSTVILLPDGRVLAAGADNMDSGGLSSPPYLFAGVRSEIASAPPSLSYGSNFELEFNSAHGANTVVLVRYSSVTHSNDMGQRHLQLASLTGGGGIVSIPAPADVNRAPPGFYMLSVVDAEGVPSVARSIRVGAAPGGFTRLGGGLAGSLGIPSLDATGDLAAGTPFSVTLGGALSNAPRYLVVGFIELSAPFKGGTLVLVPAPNLVVAGPSTGPSGSITVNDNFPAGIPPGFLLWIQYWIQDTSGPAGFASGHGLVGQTP